MKPELDPVIILTYLSVIHDGDWSSIMKDIEKHVDINYDEALQVVANIPTPHVSILEDGYPVQLRNTYHPPLVLYYRGNLDLIKDEKNMLSVVGSRDACEYSLTRTKELCAAAAAEGVTIVSGLARGIDTASLEAAVKHGTAVAVLGNGLGRCYPSENFGLQKQIETMGLVISEYPYYSSPDFRHFPDRNRIIAGLSKTLMVGEAKANSGTMISVAYATRFGKDVGVLPFRANEESACNRLIRDGAALLETKEDLFDFIGFPPGCLPSKEPMKK